MLGIFKTYGFLVIIILVFFHKDLLSLFLLPTVHVGFRCLWKDATLEKAFSSTNVYRGEVGLMNYH